MTEYEIEKLFKENDLHWTSEWLGTRYDFNNKPYSIKNEIWHGEKRISIWYSSVESMTERCEMANKYLTQKRRGEKLKDLGI